MENQTVEFLYLSEQDMIKAGVLRAKRCVEVTDEVFHLLGQGDYLMGGPEAESHGHMIQFPKESKFPQMPIAGPDRRYMAMPAYLGGRFHVTGLKWYGSNRANINKGLPRSILMVCLNDADTGAPMAIMSANLLSAMRTGSVPGVATKYLANRSAENLAVIGCGVINRACTRAILENMPSAKKMYLYDVVHEQCEKFAEELKTEYKVEIEIVNSLEKAIENGDIITVAVSGEKGVNINPAWLKPGCLLTSSGAISLPNQAFIDNTVALDHWPMHKLWLEEALLHKDGLDAGFAWGATSASLLKMVHEGRIDPTTFLSLGNVVIGGRTRKSKDEIIIFISGGLPVEDLAWGMECYEQAKKLGLGQSNKVWDTPHWR
ncbi:MAG: ornithine cyclodeaminase [Clostridiales bacterium]|jgi:ornithine cyclodeaminase|nr:ornithine cyclodeaminase [Clostridiales bacterium]